jgi:hypothetical protein
MHLKINMVLFKCSFHMSKRAKCCPFLNMLHIATRDLQYHDAELVEKAFRNIR